jgi:hypothetical protein
MNLRYSETKGMTVINYKGRFYCYLHSDACLRSATSAANSMTPYGPNQSVQITKHSSIVKKQGMNPIPPMHSTQHYTKPRFHATSHEIDIYLRSWALLQKLPIVQLLKNFPTFYRTRRFITVFTRALHWSLSRARSIQSIPSHPKIYFNIVQPPTSWSF